MKTLRKLQSIEECLHFLKFNDIDYAIIFSSISGFDRPTTWNREMIVGIYEDDSLKIKNMINGPYYLEYEVPDLLNVGFNEIIKNKNNNIKFRRKNRRFMTLSKNGPATYVFDIENNCNFQLCLEDITAHDWSIYFI